MSGLENTTPTRLRALTGKGVSCVESVKGVWTDAGFRDKGVPTAGDRGDDLTGTGGGGMLLSNAGSGCSLKMSSSSSSKLRSMGGSRRRFLLPLAWSEVSGDCDSSVLLSRAGDGVQRIPSDAAGDGDRAGGELARSGDGALTSPCVLKKSIAALSSSSRSLRARSSLACFWAALSAAISSAVLGASPFFTFLAARDRAVLACPLDLDLPDEPWANSSPSSASASSSSS